MGTAAAFAALAEPTRRHILDLLRERPRPVGELVQSLGLSQPGTSKHLRVLRRAGLVHVRQDAQRRWYELHPEPLLEVDAWLEPYRQLWSRSLDGLERHLDAADSASLSAQPRKDIAPQHASQRNAPPRRQRPQHPPL